MILNTTEELKKYIAISDSFIFEDIKPYIKKAVNNFTKRVVGNLHEVLEIEATDTDVNADLKNKAREELRNALSNFAWFLYLPFGQLQMDSSGISIATNENRKAAEFWQIKDLRREALHSGHQAMDSLLEILEENPNIFPNYTAKYSTINNELMVNSAIVFSKYYNINDSRQVYLALQATIRRIEDQYIKSFLSADLLRDLKKATTPIFKEVKESLQKAIVSFTVAKIASTGLFILDDKGLRIDLESFLDGRRENPTYGKPVIQLDKLIEDLINDGMQYLLETKKIIQDNENQFLNYSNVFKENKTQKANNTYDSKGILGL